MGDDVETMSIRTDTSDDDFEHMSLDEADEVPAFFHDQPPAEVTQTGDNYSDAGDIADSASMYAESSTTKGKEMVNLWFQLSGQLPVFTFQVYVLIVHLNKFLLKYILHCLCMGPFLPWETMDAPEN